MRVGGSKVTLQGLDPQTRPRRVGLKVERRKVKSHYLRQGGGASERGMQWLQMTGA